MESPYAGEVELNVAYARRCMVDSLRRGEAPFLSHLLYTQGLDDLVAEERKLGMEAGFAWGGVGEEVAFYVDRGISSGMVQGFVRNILPFGRGRPWSVRALDREVADEDSIRLVDLVLTRVEFTDTDSVWAKEEVRT